MEDSHDMHCEGDTLSIGKNKKRRLKTPAQVEALEEFYNEHKYPSESMKSQFADKIGLSEKQVSGWFCHRRLKDKKLLKDEIYADGISNSVVHDWISGLRQESCSSTKHGDYRHFDPREVESKRFYSRYSSAAVLASEERDQHICTKSYNTGADGSSGSSSTSQERSPLQAEDPYLMESSKHSFEADDYMLMENKGVKNRGFIVQSGHSYLQAEIESPAVSAVKRQLGRHYRENGPPLGVQFDPLPPGAFGSPIRDSNHVHLTEPCYVEDSILQHSCSIHRVSKEPKVHDRYRCEMLSSGSYHERCGFRRTMQESNHHDEFIGYQLTSKASLPKNSDHALGHIFVTEKREDFTDEAYNFNSKSQGTWFKYRLERKSDSWVDQDFYLHGQKANTEKSLAYPRLPNDNSAPMFREEEYFGAKHAKPALLHNDFLHTEDIMQPKRPTKRETIYKERRNNDYHNPVRLEILTKKETKMGRKLRDEEFRQQDWLMKNLSEEFPWTKPVKRYIGQLPTVSARMKLEALPL